MKKLIAATALCAALIAVPTVQAETVECPTSQYGGATCGVSISTEVTVTHETVEAGIADWQLWQVIAFAGGTALLASVLYKLTYRLYIFG